MIKKIANTLPNLVHTILSKLNKDDGRGEERGAPAGPSSSSSSKPAPSSKQAKNPFVSTRDYLDHTLEAITAKTGMTIPPHLYHALVNCLLTNNHLVIDSSFIEGGAHATGFALYNILPYLVGLRCSYVMCTSSTTPNEIFRKLVDPHSISRNTASADSDTETSPLIPLSLSLTTTPPSVPVSIPVSAPPKPSSSSVRVPDSPTSRRSPNTTRHQRRQSRLRPTSESLSEETIQLALNPNITASQSSLPHHPIQKAAQGPIYAQVLIVDNLLSAPANTLTALYQVMKNKQVPLKGYKYNTPSVFIVVAVTGKKRFPALSPTPFLMSIPFFEPLIAAHSSEPPTLALTEGEILQARTAVTSIYVAQDIHQYMRNIVMALRNHSAVDVGPDTLAVSAFEIAARAAAVIAGQKFVTPTHIFSVVGQVLNHRASLTPISPSPANPLSFAFPNSLTPIHATSRFMNYVHAGRERNTNNKNTTNTNSNTTNPTNTTTTTSTTSNFASSSTNNTNTITNSTTANTTNPLNTSSSINPLNTSSSIPPIVLSPPQEITTQNISRANSNLNTSTNSNSNSSSNSNSNATPISALTASLNANANSKPNTTTTTSTSNTNSNINSNSTPNPNSNSNNISTLNTSANTSLNTSQITKPANTQIAFFLPNFPEPPSPEVYSDTFELIENLLNNLDTPV